MPGSSIYKVVQFPCHGLNVSCLALLCRPLAEAVPRAVAYLSERSCVVAEVVADVVQAQQVRVQHGQHVAEGAEGAGLDFQLGGQIVDDSVGYPACNLRKNGHSMFLRGHDVSCGCLVGFHKMS